MPNHSTNRFTFKTLTEKQLKEISEKLKGKNQLIDFNNFVPQKEIVINWACSNDTIKAINIFYRDNPFDLTFEEFKELLDEDTEFIIKDFVKIDKTTIEMYAKDKNIKESEMTIKEWYDWNIKNWGTKWNAYDIYIGKQEISFHTAWGRPYDEVLNGITNVIAEALGKDHYTIEYVNYTEGYDDIDFYSWDNDLKELVLVKTEKIEYEYSDEEEE